MTHDSDDPKLTAFALGELADREKQKLLADIADDGQSQQELEETRMMAEMLQNTLQEEPAPSLDQRRRAAVLSQLRRSGWHGQRNIIMPIWVLITLVLGIVFIYGILYILLHIGAFTKKTDGDDIPKNLPSMTTTSPTSQPTDRPAKK